MSSTNRGPSVGRLIQGCDRSSANRSAAGTARFSLSGCGLLRKGDWDWERLPERRVKEAGYDARIARDRVARSRDGSSPRGKTIVDVKILQPKCLNVPARRFRTVLAGAGVREVRSRGKWIFVDTTQGWVLLNMGMGGEILWVQREAMPEKWRVSFAFDDGTALALNFWWFGHVHYAGAGKLGKHAMTSQLGPEATEITRDRLQQMVTGKRGAVKARLLDQSKMAGIGNAYVHDILFMARLHPLRRLETLRQEEVDALAQAIQVGLLPSIERGGAFYEVDLYGKRGGFTRDDMLIGYRGGKTCPACGTVIEKIKTSSTSSFICPMCQPA